MLAVIITLSGIVNTAMPDYAYAETERETGFKRTNVLTDLQSSEIDGKPFDITAYPFDESRDIQVITFVEYCYSYKRNLQKNYGLYVYVYNPKGLNLATDSKSNKIQMAVKYDGNGRATDYVKFNLEFCSKSEEADYRNLFYKFKITDKTVNGTTFYERVNSNARRYDVSGIELMTYGETRATEYFVGGTYTFTGYAAGYGPDADAKSTLECDAEYLESVTLDVKHTFYRTKTSAKGAGYQNQLDTVYFAVPERFFDTYGKLQRIKAEWYEYKTKDIVVTSNGDFYRKVKPYTGVPVNPVNEYGMTEYNKDIYYGLGQSISESGGLHAAKWGYNLGTGYLHPACSALYYLFLADDIKAYDPYADTVSNGGVSSNALYEYILRYDKSFESGTLPVKDGAISADLFADDIDGYRKLDTEYGRIQQGYSYYDFDADVDLQKLSSWQEGNPSFWDNWINWGLINTMFGGIPQEESRTVSPIYTLKESDLQGTDAEIADRLLINANDVSALREYYNGAATVNGLDDEEKAVVLFRFAASDYYSAETDVVERGAGLFGTDKRTGGQAYRATESVFLDFDVIMLTFNRTGEYTVIPAVSSPIDIVNAVTPPVLFDEPDWWKILIGVVLFIALLPIIFRVIVWIIMLPFKAVAAIIRVFKKAKKEK